MPAQNSAEPDVPSELDICVRPDVQSHGLLCFFNIFQRSTTTLSEVLGAPKAKPIQTSFLVECIPLTLQRARLRKSWGTEKTNQFKQVSWWNAFHGHCEASLFKAISFRLKGFARQTRSISVGQREKCDFEQHSIHVFDRVPESSVGLKNPYYCSLWCDHK